MISSQEAATTFGAIYHSDAWHGGSGEGSTPENTASYRAFLQDFLDQKGIRTVVDLGCGDWQIGRLLDWEGIDVLALDVVESVITGNRRNFQSHSVSFLCHDALVHPLPSADLLIAKDVFQHWSNDQILRFLPQLSSYRYALITNDLALDHNADIPLGAHRPLDLRLPPFSFPLIDVLRYEVNERKEGKRTTKAVFLHEAAPVFSHPRMSMN
jgi:SAM-dependent methyltransferase